MPLIDLQEAEGRRQAKPSRTRGSGIEPEHAALSLGQGLVGVAEDHDLEAPAGGVRPHRRAVVEEEDPSAPQLQATPVGEPSTCT